MTPTQANYYDNTNNPNIGLLDRTLDFLKANPKLHNQNVWMAFDTDDHSPPPLESAENAPCGTTGCLAGWATILSGAKISWEEDGFSNDDEDEEGYSRTYFHWQPARVIAPDGTTIRSVKDYAAMVLRLDAISASELFHASNSLTALKRMRDHLAIHGNLDYY